VLATTGDLPAMRELRLSRAFDALLHIPPLNRYPAAAAAAHPPAAVADRCACNAVGARLP
jgi:hypothetical protein